MLYIHIYSSRCEEFTFQYRCTSALTATRHSQFTIHHSPGDFNFLDDLRHYIIRRYAFHFLFRRKHYTVP